jgi:SAM-dependent methyltransferase
LTPKYDQIGINYAQKRKSDPRIAAQILNRLKGAQRILNIGAGTGSYEPQDMNLVALEPSLEMIKQRSADAHPVVQGRAEALPFDNDSFTHALTILSMHHWEDQALAFQEINRVVKEKFITVSWNPESRGFWFTQDYFPEIVEMGQDSFPSISLFEQYFEDVSVEPLLIPEDCMDGFLAAYWKRPTAYLDQNVRNSISSFSKLDHIESPLQQLEQDIQSGAWHEKNRSILDQTALDAGYIMISASIKKD